MAKKTAARPKKAKLTDLPVKRGKGGQADKIKGGAVSIVLKIGKVQ